MLVLSRKESERIRLGDSIVVTVVRLAGDKVRLGIEAPADMLVLREELDTGTFPASPGALAADNRRESQRASAVSQSISPNLVN